MAYVDRVFINNVNEILEYGTVDEGNVRAHWPDGKPAHTKRIFNICNKYDLRQEFPLMTLRAHDLQKAVDEMCWIYQRKSNNIRDLHSHVWDQWADENGSVGKTYGYQAGKIYMWDDKCNMVMDQVDRALHMLVADPNSRHIIINLWNPADYAEMHLAPCCCWLQFNVHRGMLDMVLYQRSWDLMTAGGWDVAAHAALQMMFTRHVGLELGTFTHFVSNMHIYDRHESIIKGLIDRDPRPAAKVTLDPKVRNFYDIRPEHFLVEDYNPWPSIKFEVAI